MWLQRILILNNNHPKILIGQHLLATICTYLIFKNPSELNNLKWDLVFIIFKMVSNLSYLTYQSGGINEPLSQL